MKTIRQLLRQPLKTLSGLLLMTIAASILCVCVGQAIAAQATKDDLDRRFTTVAIPSPQEDLEGTERVRVEQALLDWLEQMANEHPDIVKSANPSGVLSAYIPELLPYNYMRESTPLTLSNIITPGGIHASSYNHYIASEPYAGAMLVITLEEISQVQTPVEGYLNNEEKYSLDYGAYWEEHDMWLFYHHYLCDANWRTIPNGYSVELVGTVTEVVALQDGLRDPVGMTARLTLTMPTAEQIQELNLVPGQQYVVYGVDYYDGYRFLEAHLNWEGYSHVQLKPFDPSLLEELTEDEKRRYKENGLGDVVIKYNDVPLRQWEYERLNSIYMTLCMPINLIEYDQIRDENGTLLDLIPKTEVSYLDGKGQSHTVSAEEYNRLYAVPTIAPLNGTLEAFLASTEGALWQKALEQTQTNNHAFSVIGVEEIDQLAAFAVGDVKMADGREFTKEEVEGGTKVCILHEWIAEMAGLKIGDTVTLSFYEPDYGLPYQQGRGEGKNLCQPVAAYYFDTTPKMETAEYTIVGLWRGAASPDADENLYAFSANTVFVPRSSVQSPMEESDSVVLFSAALENGMIKQFHELAKQGGYAGRFKYFEQNYSEIAANFHNYVELARQILSVGAVLYVILLMLFLLLYPGAQKTAVNTMQSLGAGFLRRFTHVMASSIGIVIPASILGGLLGLWLWDTIVTLMQATAESTVALQFELITLAKIAGVQLILVLVLNMLVELFVAAPKGMSSRR